MAARSQTLPVEFVSLRDVNGRSLESLISQQIEEWRSCLDWDFRESASLIRGFSDSQSLEGMALVVGGDVVGYTYYSVEDRKGLIGDLFVDRNYARTDLPSRLLSKSAEELLRAWNCDRVEAQLMLHDPVQLRHTSASGRPPLCVERCFMVLPEFRFGFPSRFTPSSFVSQPYGERMEEEAAKLLTECYSGHIDSTINDQYHGIPGARRFLRNIVQYPGCGAFNQSASFGLRDMNKNRLVGLLLASNISENAGHITQLCISPRYRGEGLGYHLMRQSVQALAASGVSRVSLSVTEQNRVAVSLYERVGFETTRKFLAMVWQRPSAHRRFFHL